MLEEKLLQRLFRTRSGSEHDNALVKDELLLGAPVGNMIPEHGAMIAALSYRELTASLASHSGHWQVGRSFHLYSLLRSNIYSRSYP